jgi:GntR family transcriptional regulator, transcriptional repressor for pyruvate dehydrogenase complex
MFKSIHRTKISDEVAGQVKTLIVEGKLKPGDRLPPERELIKQFGVSRPSLREALNSLVATGFLEVVQGNRTVVKSLVSGNFFEPLNNLLKEDTNTVFELIEVRKAIETWNAYLAAKRASREDISHLEDIIESMKRSLAKDGRFPEKEDADFHLAITLATHNKIQTHVMHTLHDMLKESIEKYYHKLDEEKLFEQHMGIVEAIKERNSELARARIFQHLEYVESCVREGVESERGSNDR